MKLNPDRNKTPEEKAWINGYNQGFKNATQLYDIENASLQAKIDALMLEYCPDEMTKEQVDNWAKHQKRHG